MIFHPPKCSKIRRPFAGGFEKMMRICFSILDGRYWLSLSNFKIIIPYTTLGPQIWDPILSIPPDSLHIYFGVWQILGPAPFLLTMAMDPRKRWFKARDLSVALDIKCYLGSWVIDLVGRWLWKNWGAQIVQFFCVSLYIYILIYLYIN